MSANLDLNMVRRASTMRAATTRFATSMSGGQIQAQPESTSTFIATMRASPTRVETVKRQALMPTAVSGPAAVPGAVFA